MTKSERPNNRMSVKTGPDTIAIGLQHLFAPLAAEAIPDEFMALLDRIDARARDVSAQTRAGDQAKVEARSTVGDTGVDR